MENPDGEDPEGLNEIDMENYKTIKRKKRKKVDCRNFLKRLTP